MKQFNVKQFLINHYTQVDSTQDECKRRIDSGVIIDGFAVLSDYQTKARGRYNREWNSRKGNLSISYCLKNDFEIPDQLSLITGVTIFEVLKNLSIQNIKLKWVNDILIGKKKISGILIEAYKGFLIIGVGCNILNFKKMNELNASSLEQNGIKISNVDLARDLSEKFSQNIDHYQKYGFLKFYNCWLNHAFKLGEEITVRYRDKEITGIFKTIDENGKLVLDNNGKYHIITAGELFEI